MTDEKIFRCTMDDSDYAVVSEMPSTVHVMIRRGGMIRGSVYLTPDDADELANLIAETASEIREKAREEAVKTIATGGGDLHLEPSRAEDGGLFVVFPNWVGHLTREQLDELRAALDSIAALDGGE